MLIRSWWSVMRLCAFLRPRVGFDSAVAHPDLSKYRKILVLKRAVSQHVFASKFKQDSSIKSMQCNFRNPEQLLDLTSQVSSAFGREPTHLWQWKSPTDHCVGSEDEVSEEELSEDEVCVESEDGVDYDYTDENGNLVGLVEPYSSEVDSTEPSSSHRPIGSISMSSRMYGLRRSRTRRSPALPIMANSSDLSSSPSPCSRTRDIRQSFPAMHQDSLSDCLENAILALDELGELLRNVKLEIDQITEGNRHWYSI